MKRLLRFFSVLAFSLAVFLLLVLSYSPLVFAQNEGVDDRTSFEVHSSIERRWEKHLPPSRTQEPKIDPKTTKEQQMPHPFAEKGLVRITHDKVYLYRTKKSDQNRASSIRIGFFDHTGFTRLETDVAFSSLYTKSSTPIIFYDYEWQLWQGFGKFGWKLGTGIYVARGNGAFKSKDNSALIPREKFTFITFPNSISFIYRLQFWDTQIIVPFIEGGGDMIAFFESRDDERFPKFGSAPATHVAVGASFNLGFLGADSTIELDREYGINSIWLTGEYRTLFGLSNRLDFTFDIINFGFLFEF